MAPRALRVLLACAVVALATLTLGSARNSSLVPTVRAATGSGGAVWAWDGNAITQPAVQIAFPADATITAIANGEAFSLALDSTGEDWSWGDNFWGELGNGTIATTCCPSTSIPGQVAFPAGTTITAISGGGDFGLALDSTGKVWGWGDNYFSEIGNGTTQTSGCYGCNPPGGNDCLCVATPTPVTFPAGTTITAISAGGDHTLALDSTGKVWGWGGNV